MVNEGVDNAAYAIHSRTGHRIGRVFPTIGGCKSHITQSLRYGLHSDHARYEGCVIVKYLPGEVVYTCPHYIKKEKRWVPDV